MERHELAEKCERIDQAGGNVREYLKEQGFVSPWGTWYRLQIEELGRKGNQISEGRGKGDMKRLTREQKEAAVRIALNGGAPTAYLRTLGSKSPSATWFNIKKTLKETNPDLYRKLTDKEPEEEQKEEHRPVTTCCAPAPASGVEVPDELPEEKPVSPEVVLTIKSEDLPRALDETPHVSSITKPVNYDGFEVTGLKTTYGEWHVSNNGYLFFGANLHDQLEMPVEVWRMFAADLPRVMQILGIA